VVWSILIPNPGPGRDGDASDPVLDRLGQHDLADRVLGRVELQHWLLREEAGRLVRDHRRQLPLFSLDPGGANHLAPFRVLSGDQPVELFERERLRLDADLLET
jgi:hypothetical protein